MAKIQPVGNGKVSINGQYSPIQKIMSRYEDETPESIKSEQNLANAAMQTGDEHIIRYVNSELNNGITAPSYYFLYQALILQEEKSMNLLKRKAAEFATDNYVGKSKEQSEYFHQQHNQQTDHRTKNKDRRLEEFKTNPPKPIGPLSPY